MKFEPEPSLRQLSALTTKQSGVKLGKNIGDGSKIAGLNIQRHESIQASMQTTIDFTSTQINTVISKGNKVFLLTYLYEYA